MKYIFVARPDYLDRMKRLIGRFFLMAALFALPAMAWAQPMTLWDRDHPLPTRLGPFGLSFSRTWASNGEGHGILRVTDTVGRKTDVKIEFAFDNDVFVSLGVGKIDPDSATRQLLVTSYTGGAHCCVHIQILELLDGQWHTLDVGTFDGVPLSSFPTDIDGDGITDIERLDDRFAYAFDCYACSWMPPRVFNISAGKVQDVSAAPRYRALYVKDSERAKSKCVKHDNAACAGLVADGYRLGRAGEAWSIAMANIEPNDAWLLPGCKVTVTNGECPEPQQFHSGEFREALMQFLIENDIAPAAR